MFADALSVRLGEVGASRGATVRHAAASDAFAGATSPDSRSAVLEEESEVDSRGDETGALDASGDDEESKAPLDWRSRITASDEEAGASAHCSAFSAGSTLGSVPSAGFILFAIGRSAKPKDGAKKKRAITGSSCLKGALRRRPEAPPGSAARTMDELLGFAIGGLKGQKAKDVHGIAAPCGADPTETNALTW